MTKRATLAAVAISAAAIGLIDMAQAKPITGDRVASYELGFSGATLSIRESFGKAGWPVADRAFILVGASGRRRELKLQRGGGTEGNASLNLFWVDSEKYFLVSEKDCVEFDPIKVTAKFCPARPPCENGKIRGLTYLGRYDWMNGYNRPKGLFGWNFRFLPFTDAWESETCPKSSK